MLLGEPQTAIVAANFIIGTPLPPQQILPINFYSTTHRTNIQLHDMMAFLTLGNDPENFRSKEFFLKFRPEIEAISGGENIWDPNSDDGMKNFLR